jgi:hypothetical protein
MDRHTSFAMTNRGVNRHCEHSAAVHDCAFSMMDRHTSFAMTNRGVNRHCERSAAVHDPAFFADGSPRLARDGEGEGI